MEAQDFPGDQAWTRHDMRSPGTVFTQRSCTQGARNRGFRTAETIFRDSTARVHLPSPARGPSQTYTTPAQIHISPINGICPSFSASSSWLIQIRSTQVQILQYMNLRGIKAS